MKEKKFVEAMGEIDSKYIDEVLNYKNERMKTKWVRWGVIAACVTLLCFGGAAIISSGSSGRKVNTWDNSQFPDFDSSVVGDELTPDEQLSCELTIDMKETKKIPIGKYNGVYEKVLVTDKDALVEWVGEIAPGPKTWYYILGHTDKQYLIRYYGGQYSLWKFKCFDSKEYPYRDVLELVYQIYSADEFEKIEVRAVKHDNTYTGKAIQKEIGSYTVTDRTEIEIIYQILASMTCYTDEREFDYWGVEDEGMWLGRSLKLVTSYGSEIDELLYTGVSDRFYEAKVISYSCLSEEQAESVCEILQIRMGTLQK